MSSKWSSMELSEAYTILGLDFRVKITPEMLTKKYRALALANHPDTKVWCR
jgi:DnaJ-class molecular chaperone